MTNEQVHPHFTNSLTTLSSDVGVQLLQEPRQGRVQLSEGLLASSCRFAVHRRRGVSSEERQADVQPSFPVVVELAECLLAAQQRLTLIGVTLEGQ